MTDLTDEQIENVHKCITALCEVDLEAAEWIADNLYMVNEGALFTDDADFVAGLFTWDNTLQGQEYWADICGKVMEKL